METRQPEKALGELTHSISTHDPHLRYNRGRVQSRLGQWEKARDDFSSCVMASPDHGAGLAQPASGQRTGKMGRVKPITLGPRRFPGPFVPASIVGGANERTATLLLTKRNGKTSSAISRSSSRRPKENGGSGEHWPSLRLLCSDGMHLFRASRRPSNERTTTRKAGSAGRVLMPIAAVVSRHQRLLGRQQVDERSRFVGVVLAGRGP